MYVIVTKAFSRIDFFVKGVDCPAGMEYQTCSWNITCDEFGVVRDCRNETCQSGCFCSNGYVLEDGVCVHPDMCTSKEITYTRTDLF